MQLRNMNKSLYSKKVETTYYFLGLEKRGAHNYINRFLFHLVSWPKKTYDIGEFLKDCDKDDHSI